MKNLQNTHLLNSTLTPVVIQKLQTPFFIIWIRTGSWNHSVKVIETTSQGAWRGMNRAHVSEPHTSLTQRAASSFGGFACIDITFLVRKCLAEVFQHPWFAAHHVISLRSHLFLLEAVQLRFSQCGWPTEELRVCCLTVAVEANTPLNS